jgi:molecular chaperone GrpE
VTSQRQAKGEAAQRSRGEADQRSKGEAAQRSRGEADQRSKGEAAQRSMGEADQRSMGEADQPSMPGQPQPSSPISVDVEERTAAAVETRAPEGSHPIGTAPSDMFGSSGGESDSDRPQAPHPPDALTVALSQRDEYLDSLRRLQADFENYRKRIAKSQAEQAERAATDLVTKLLPVLDTLDMALAHLTGTTFDDEPLAAGSAAEAASLAQVGSALTEVLARAGLERIDPQGQVFDPTEHDAVALDADSDAAEHEVTEVLRAGYRWKGRVLRPAMVKVRG